MKIIVKDGIKYLYHQYTNENELDTLFREHIDIIFGNDPLFFSKAKIESRSGITSIPDGFILLFKNEKWYIVEVELASHPLYEHIVPQITKFNGAIKNPATRKRLISAFYDEIEVNIHLKYRLQSIGIKTELYKVLTEIIDKDPEMVIVIDERTNELEEVCDGLPFSTRILEFKTYCREGLETKVSIHLFDTLKAHKPEQVTVSEVTSDISVKPDNKVEVVLSTLSPKKYAYIPIPKEHRRFFPGYKVPFTLETDIGEIKTKVTSAPKGTKYADPGVGNYIQGRLKPWYDKHKELAEGDKITIEVIDPKKRYKLYIKWKTL